MRARLFVAASAFVCCALATSAAPAQNAPGGPAHLLVGFAPGGTTDVVARLLADRIRQSSGQQVVVENRPGAGGRIAASELKRANPDGTTLMLTIFAVPVLMPLAFRQVGFDPVTDFAPVSHVANFQLAFAVSAHHPAATVQEFIAWASARGARVSFGTAAAGSQPHFLGVMMGRATGVDMQHVAYRGGAPLGTDLAGDHIPAGIGALSDFVEQHRAGNLRIIATSGAARSPQLPAIPTFKEQGFPGIEGSGWLAVYAPAGTPKAIVEWWAAQFAHAVQVPDSRQRLVHMGLEPTGTTASELAAIMAADIARWAPIVKASGFNGE